MASPGWVVVTGQCGARTVPPVTAAAARNGVALDRSGSTTLSTAAIAPGATRHEDGVGWVDQLAVLPDHWGNGIAGALLAESFRRFRDGGLAEAALSTDSRTGALGLYEHVGMHVDETFARLSLTL